MPESAASMGHLLQQQADLHGDREVIVVPRSQGRRSLTFAELFDRGSRLAGHLQDEAGLTKGERIAILLTNSNACDFFITVAAAYIGGFVSTPINARLAPPEIEYQLDHSGAKALVTSQEFAPVIEALRGSLPALSTIVAADSHLWPGAFTTITHAVATGSALAPGCGPDDDSDLMYTSGTTGRPKGALFTHRAGLAHGPESQSCSHRRSTPAPDRDHSRCRHSGAEPR